MLVVGTETAAPESLEPPPPLLQPARALSAIIRVRVSVADGRVPEFVIRVILVFPSSVRRTRKRCEITSK
jgi:hypothetical protein